MSYRRLFVLVLLLFVGAAVRRTQTVTAGDEWQPISQEELKMTSVPEAPGAPAISLYRQVDRKDLGRANTEYNYFRIKILTEEGRKYGTVIIEYPRSKVFLPNERNRLITVRSPENGATPRRSLDESSVKLGLRRLEYSSRSILHSTSDETLGAFAPPLAAPRTYEFLDVAQS